MQPPSGGCVLKLFRYQLNANQKQQPPSGGCVLKRLVLCAIIFTAPGSRLRAAVC